MSDPTTEIVPVSAETEVASVPVTQEPEEKLRANIKDDKPPKGWAPALNNELHAWSRNTHSKLLKIPTFYRVGIAGLTAETRELLLKETEGRFRAAPGQPLKRLGMSPEEELQKRRIVEGKEACPFCGSIGRAGKVYRIVIGKHTGVCVEFPYDCYCLIYHRFFDEWLKPANIPLDYRDCTWDNFLANAPAIQNRFKATNRETYKLIRAVILKHPDYNMLFCGKAGAGKTTLLTVLYDRALGAWAVESYSRQGCDPAVWKTGVQTLISEHIDWVKPREKDDPTPVKLPHVMTEKVMTALLPRNQYKPHVSITELDKYKLSSDFQNNVLHKIMDVTQSNTGQIVCDSNLGIKALVQRIGYQHGPSMIRRLVGEPRGIYIDFWSGKVYINKIRHKLGSDGNLIPMPEEHLDALIPDTDPDGKFEGKSNFSPKENSERNGSSTRVSAVSASTSHNRKPGNNYSSGGGGQSREPRVYPYFPDTESESMTKKLANAGKGVRTSTRNKESNDDE